MDITPLTARYTAAKAIALTICLCSNFSYADSAGELSLGSDYTSSMELSLENIQEQLDQLEEDVKESNSKAESAYSKAESAYTKAESVEQKLDNAIRVQWYCSYTVSGNSDHTYAAYHDVTYSLGQRIPYEITVRSVGSSYFKPSSSGRYGWTCKK